MTQRWIIDPPAPNLDEMSRSWGVAPIVAQVLLNRDVPPDQAGLAFLNPKLGDLYPPELLPGMEAATEVIARAIEERRRIVIYGDYDVDGIAGVAILWHVLTAANAAPAFYVPHRISEGYGLNSAALAKLANDGAELIISVDCGVTAVDEVAEMKSRGVRMVITDHHTPGDEMPAADAIVHPALEAYPNRNLCGAGVALKLAWSVAQRLSGAARVTPEYRRLLTEMLPLAALGTIADVVPLTGENRTIARHGLAALPSSELPGVRALIDIAGLKNAQISGQDAGFKLAPRMNAAGRLGHARLAIELLTRADSIRAREIAEYLEDQNKKRQTMERRMAKEACELIDAGNLASDARRAIVLASDQWHAGVIGIVASRLVSRYHRPAVLIALGEECGQGSARSIRHFDLAHALQHCETHLISHGGHAMAAGLRIEEAKIGDFADAFVEHANNRLTGADLVPQLRLDAEVALEELSIATTTALANLGPFGQGHPKPKLATGWVELVTEPRCVGKNGDHLQALFSDQGKQMKAIGFGLGKHIQELKNHRRCRVAFEPIINEFNGSRTVEMQVIDFKFPS